MPPTAKAERSPVRCPCSRAAGRCRLRLPADDGYALAGVLAFVAVLLATGAAATRLVRDDLKRTAEQAARQRAFYAAEAAVEHALSQLHVDQQQASRSVSYAASGGGSLEGARYRFAIDQDPNFPADPLRKRIRATGEAAGSDAAIVAHAFVQPTGPETCDALLASHSGQARLFAVAAATVGRRSDPPVVRSLFDGEIFTNPGHDVVFTILANLSAKARGAVVAGRDFVSNSEIALPSAFDASLVYGGRYRIGPLEAAHLHLAPDAPSLQGVHFNGRNDAGAGHGTRLAVPARAFWLPDRAALARSRRTVLVNAETVGRGIVPGRWRDGTWEVRGGVLFGSFRLDPEVVYAVEGNASLDSLFLAAGTTATVAARGWIAIGNLGLLASSSPCASLPRMPGGPASGPSLCIPAGPASRQTLHLLAERDLVIGRPAIDVALNPLAEELFLRSEVVPGTGLGTSVANLGGRTAILGYSETANVWALVSLVSLGADTRLNLCARRDATLAFAASVSDRVTTYRPES